MQRFLIPALAAAVVAGGTWLAPAPASAQNYGRTQNYDRNQNYGQNRNNQNGATAWGDPWMNENDFDYNRRHWLPGPGDRRQGYNEDRDWGRYGRNDNDYGRRDQYGGNWNRQGNYDNRSGLGRNYRPDNRYQYDDEDDE